MSTNRRLHWFIFGSELLTRLARGPRSWASVILLTGIVLFGCSSRSVSPTAVPKPTITCDGLAASDCVAAKEVLLGLIHDKRWLATSIEIGKGTFCAVPGHLFDHSLCPDVRPSGVHAAVGSAVISLSGTSQQAYVNLYAGPNGVITQLLDLATPPPSPS
jgi:hypothetical protein